MSDMNISKLKPIINLFIVNDIDFLRQKQKFQIMEIEPTFSGHGDCLKLMSSGKRELHPIKS